MCKWGLVIAGLGDLKRPVENVSPLQSGGMRSSLLYLGAILTDILIALACTGVIWARYSTQIVPANYSLLSVNAFVGSTGIYQLYRIYR